MPIMDEINYITVEKKEALKEELNHLKTVKRKDILEALAEWFPQPPGFHPVILCCAKCGHLSKVTIDSEVSADDLAGWAMIHEEGLK